MKHGDWRFVGKMVGDTPYCLIYEGVSVGGRPFVGRFDANGQGQDGLHLGFVPNFPEPLEEWRL